MICDFIETKVCNIDNLYNYDNSELTIIPWTNNFNKIKLKETLKKLKISDYFCQNINLEKLELPNTIQEIKLHNHTSLDNINFPNSLKKLSFNENSRF